MPKPVNRDDKPSTTPTPDSPPATDAVNAELAELRQLAKSQASQIDELRNLISDIRRNPSPTPAAQLLVDQREKPIDKLNRRIREQEEARQAVEDQLAAGGRQFEVSMEGEPRMTRIIGAHSDHEARGKYLAYFGVLGTSKGVRVQEVGGGSDTPHPTPESQSNPGTMSRR